MKKQTTNTAIAALALLFTQTLFAAEGATPFYAWAEQIPEDAGQLLRQEALEKELVLENASTGTRILYSSTGFAGQPVAVSGAVFMPKGEAPEGGWPVVAWAHGTVGVADVCAPSFQGRSERDVKYLNHWLAEGFAIVATDYEGLGTAGVHPYLHCESEANGVIDSVAAAHQLELPLSNRWMVTGQSQGGQAALCAASFVDQGESSLEFLGTLATAPGLNFMQRFSTGNADDPNPFIGISLLLGRGLETYEPSFKPEGAFTEKAMAMMHHTDELCIKGLTQKGYQAGYTTGETLKVIPLSEAPGVAEASKHMEIPLHQWSQPVYIAQGTKDELVRYTDVYDFSADLCRQGVDVTLQVFEGADHSGPVNNGAQDFTEWADALFANAAAKNNCETIYQLAGEEKQ